MAQRNNLGFGCISLTQHAFLKDALDILSAAFNEGITHFDTADLAEFENYTHLQLNELKNIVHAIH